MLAALKNSTESKELVKRAQDYVRGIIASIVRKKKELEARKNAANGVKAARRTPDDRVLSGHTSMQPTAATVGGEAASGHASSASILNSGYRLGKENRQSGSGFPTQAPGEVWEV